MVIENGLMWLAMPWLGKSSSRRWYSDFDGRYGVTMSHEVELSKAP